MNFATFEVDFLVLLYKNKWINIMEPPSGLGKSNESLLCDN